MAFSVGAFPLSSCRLVECEADKSLRTMEVKMKVPCAGMSNCKVFKRVSDLLVAGI